MKASFSLLLVLLLLFGSYGYADDWWNLDWRSRRPIALPEQNFTKYTTIEVDWNASFSLTGAQASLADVRIIDQNTLIDLNRTCKGSATGDGNCFFRMPRDWNSGFVNRNTQFYVYYANGGASEKTPLQISASSDSNVFGWEHDENMDFSFVSDSTNPTTNEYLFGSQSGWYSGAGGAIISQQNLPPGGSQDYNYGVSFFYVDGVFSFALTEHTVDHSCRIIVDDSSGVDFYYFNGGVKVEAFAIDRNKWYTTEFFWDGDATCFYSLYDAAGTTVFSASGDEVSNVNPDKVGADAAGATKVHLDNIFSSAPFVSGGVEASESAPSNTNDLNIWRIAGFDVNSNQFPEFTFLADGNLTIDFNVWNTDNNRMLIDINYSPSNNQGSGTVIVEDLNLSLATCDNIDWNFGAQSCSWDFNISGVSDGNYYILMDLNSGGLDTSWNTIFEATPKTFKISNPVFRMQIRDENSGAPLIGIKVLVGGVTYTTDVEGKMTANLGGLVAGETIAQIGEDSNYSTRYLEFDLNADTRIDVNFFVLRDINGTNINFRFYDSDTTTVLNQARIYVFHPDTNLTQVRRTDVSGRTSFFLAPDQNYYFVAVKSDDSIIRYDKVTLTVNVPIDEDSLALISPYNFDVTGLDNKKFSGLTANQEMFIFPDTEDFYLMDFNAGSDYFPRRYEVSVRGNPSTAILQPYLVKIIDSGDFIFNVIDSTTLVPLGSIRIVVKRNIPGTGIVETQSITTDDAGKATISLLLNKDYNAAFFFRGENIHNANIRPTTASLFYQASLDLSAFQIRPPSIGVMLITFSPTTGYIITNSNGSLDINISIGLNEKTVGAITIRAYDTNQTLFDTNFFGGVWADGNTVRMNVDINDFDQRFAFYVTVDVNSVDGNSYFSTSKHYVVVITERNTLEFGLAQLASSLNPEGSLLTTTFLAIVITMLVIGSIAAIGVHDATSLAIIALAVMGVFVFIGWMEIMIYLAAILMTFAVGVLSRAVLN